MHLFGQAAHVVVALDGLAGDVQALDAVRIDSTLCQPFGIGYLMCFGVEHFHKVTTNDLTLLFGVGHALQVLEELLAGVHTDDSVTPSRSLKNFSLASTPMTFSPRHS